MITTTIPSGGASVVVVNIGTFPDSKAESEGPLAQAPSSSEMMAVTMTQRGRTSLLKVVGSGSVVRKRLRVDPQ